MGVLNGKTIYVGIIWDGFRVKSVRTFTTKKAVAASYSLSVEVVKHLLESGCSLKWTDAGNVTMELSVTDSGLQALERGGKR